MPEMNDERCDLGAVVFNDTLVVCGGGHGGKNVLSSLEAYDAKLNKWNEISSLK